MSDQLPPDLSGLDRKAWLTALDAFGEDRGYFEPIGDLHSALFCDEGPVLLVSFETVESAQARPMGLPMGLANATTRGWSSLTLLADGPTWFRDRRLFGYFDRLVDDGFFEDFDRVIFLGAGMCAYAACAYSVAAPGATVLAFRPRATPEVETADFDAQDAQKRRTDDRDRYYYAPHMIEAADRAFLFYDPGETADAEQVALFTCENCTPIRLRHSLKNPLGMVTGMGALVELLNLAGSAAGLRPLDVYKSLRRRRMHHLYTRRLVTHLAEHGKLFQLAKATRHLFIRMRRGRYGNDYRWSTKRMEDLGMELPAPLPRSRAKPGVGGARNLTDVENV